MRIGRVARWIGTALLTLIVLLILVLLLFPLNLLKEPIEDAVAAATGRNLNIEGDLDIDWGLRPRLEAGALQFANADWSEEPVMAEAGAIAVSIDIPALFTGELVIPELRLVEPRLLLERHADGRANWELRDEEEPPEPTRLPNIERLQIENGRLHYRELDGSTDLQVTVVSGDRAARDANGTQAQDLHIKGEGRLNGEVFALDARGDSLLGLYDSEQPYQLRVELEAEETQISVAGAMRDPQAFDGLDLQIDMAGPDPARLNKLLAIALPNLPPYQVRGKLQREGKVWRFRDFAGEVGDSDLHGDLIVDTAGKLPMVTAELQSETLNFGDLGSLVGGGPPEAGETASPGEEHADAAAQDRLRVLPDAPLDVEKLQEFNAKVSYRATRVNAGELPIDELIVDFALQDGEMRLNPVSLQIGDGTLQLEIQTKTSARPVTTQLSAEVRNLDLRRVLSTLEVGDESAGTLAGRAKLWMTGDSIAKLLGSADGGLYLLMSGGHLDQLLVELAGLDAAESVAAVLGDEEEVPIECAYADLQSNDGLVRVATLVIDTTDTLFFADGNINLKHETLNLELRPEPKDWSPVSLRGPLHIEGRLGDIALRPGASVLARGAAAVLSAAAAPFAALLPLIETGPAEGEGSPLCGGLMESMKRETKQEQREE